MVVHADEAGEDGVAGEVEVQRRRAVGAGEVVVLFGEDGGDLASGENDCRVFERRRAGAVDDADVFEPDGVLGVVVLDVALDVG